MGNTTRQCMTSAYVYGTQEEPRGKQCVTRAHTASGFGPSRRGGGHTETSMASIGDSPNITRHCLGVRDALHAIAPSMCRRRHVYVRAWAMRRRRHVVHGHGRTFTLITFLSVTDIYTLAQNRCPCCTIPCLASRSAIIC